MEIKGNQSLKDSAAGGQSDQTETSRKVHWDESNARRFSSDAFMAGFNQGEIALRWGINQKKDGQKEAGQKENGQKVDGDPGSTRIRLLSQTIMSPYTAKKLAGALAMVIRQYEDRYGVLEIKASPEEALDQRQDRTHERETQLLHLAKGLDVKMGFERSFRMSQGSLLENRFLLGANKGEIGPHTNEKIRYICEHMDMPKGLWQDFEKRLPDADYVHFGFEEKGKTCLFKVYLEFYEKIKTGASTRPGQDDPVLLHLGFKWDPSDTAKAVVTSYNWYPSISIDAIQEKSSSLLDLHTCGKLLEIAGAMVNLASARISDRDILFLEVTEENNPRASFDINFYKADIQLEELYPFFLEICRHYSISFKAFHRLYEKIKEKTFGHMSCGVDRDGRDFFTVYYGAESVDGGDPSSFPGHGSLLTGRPGRRSQRRRPFSIGVEETDEKARLLFGLVKELHTRVGLERSFKFFQKTLLSDRLLLVFESEGIRPEPHESILAICKQIDMPGEFLEDFERSLAESSIVSFGFERSETHSCIYKTYLEFSERMARAARENPGNPGPVVVNRGFKWDASDNSRKTAATYTCFPLLSLQEMLKRMSGVLYGGEREGICSLAESLLKIAAARIDPKHFLYFEASEGNNPRRSFDINMYAADLRLSELYPLLLQICWNYAISYTDFNEVYEPVKTQKFGHLTGGTDREGRDFFVVYFGEEESPGAAYDGYSP